MLNAIGVICFGIVGAWLVSVVSIERETNPKIAAAVRRYLRGIGAQPCEIETRAAAFIANLETQPQHIRAANIAVLLKW